MEDVLKLQYGVRIVSLEFPEAFSDSGRSRCV